MAQESLLSDALQRKKKESGGKVPASFVKKKEKAACHRVSVLVTRPFPGLLDYLSDKPLLPGTIVHVPLGKGESIGCVWDGYSKELPADLRPVGEKYVFPVERLRFVRDVVADVPCLPESLRHFIDWVAAYTLASPGLVLAIAVRVPAMGSVRPCLGWVRVSEILPETLRLTPARQAVLGVASLDTPYTTADLVKRSRTSAAVVRGLAAAGGLKEAIIAQGIHFPVPLPAYSLPHFSQVQVQAVEMLVEAVEKRTFGVTLLEGVTGSGKTEVYFEAVAACLRQARQVLVLLPEIALTAQWTKRFISRFGVAPAIWHSGLGQKARRETWCAIAEGHASVVVGARSALFLPFVSLGLVIVDEEHEASFKQEEGVLYHGRDMAVVRGRLMDAPVVLVSATPSLETLANVEQGRYRHIVLESRYGGAQLPETFLLDMKQEGPERGLFLAPALCTAIEQNLQAGEQTLLFLNRRGYAPLMLCRACGHRLQCPNCSAWMVEHRARRVLACHHCEHVEPIVSRCSECQAEESLVSVGPGVERIKEEAETRFPEARLLVMATDTMVTPAVVEDAVRQIMDGTVNLIIGTQMVAKGWHFPNLTLGGVVDADLGLGGGDLRAAERTMQLLHQVSGRAGRGEKPGRVFLQSYVGDHPVMQALQAHDFQRFMEYEATQRRPGFWPPYGRLAALIVSAPKEGQADMVARQLAMAAPQGEGIQVLGPTPAPLAMLRGRHRRRLLLRTRRGIALQPLLRHWLASLKCSEGTRIDVDIDPVSFM